jgi:hypothetical protein
MISCSDSILLRHIYRVSDPLLQFGIVLAALLHDAGHDGGGWAVCHHGSNKHSNSPDVDKAIHLLLTDSNYNGLRAIICPDAVSCRRLQQLLVDAIGATKAFDASLQRRQLERKVGGGAAATSTPVITEDRCADNPGTVAMEALMQASDVLHTMQPWAIYRDWNERLFAEHYQAFKEGKSDVDPSSIWFKAEIAFLDFYILPLAKRLQDCGVFGRLGNECYGFAKANRLAWRLKGPSAVNDMIRKVSLEQAQSEWK